MVMHKLGTFTCSHHRQPSLSAQTLMTSHISAWCPRAPRKSDKLVQRPLTAGKVKLIPDMPWCAQARGVHVDGEV